MNQSLFQHHKQQEHCPQCGGLLQIKNSKKGRFLGCTNYPQCDYLRPLQRVEHKVLKELAERCPICGNLLQLKQGNFGMFIGCSGYPECHFVVHDEQQTDAEIACPECKNGHLMARRGQRGKTFYGCSNYPSCKFSLPSQPYLETCPECAFPLATLKSENAQQRVFQCARKSCHHQFSQNKE